MQNLSLSLRCTGGGYHNLASRRHCRSGHLLIREFAYSCMLGLYMYVLSTPCTVLTSHSTATIYILPLPI
jgi:hypothetical protein